MNWECGRCATLVCCLLLQIGRRLRSMARRRIPPIHEKAAVLLESIVRNHPLVDGNKRLGWLAVVVFDGLNSLSLDAPEDPANDLVIGGATGQMDYQSVAEALSAWVS
jgi:death on curing protein